MKRIIAAFLACLILIGCASVPKTALSEMLGTQGENTYTSPLGFVIDTADLTLLSAEDLAAVNQVEEFTPEALTKQTDNGNAIAVFASATTGGASIVLSLFPADGLPKGTKTAADYAAYGLPLISEKLESAGYANVQAQQVSIKLDGKEHPAILCSAQITAEVPYHLLQICFCEGDWMGALRLSSVESEDVLQELLLRISTTD